MGEPKRVLLVEDSPTMRAFAVAALEAEGFAVTTAGSGFEALKILPRSRFDVIITDINMPDITGLELIRFVRESAVHSKVPLVIISTDGAERDRERGLKLGADAYLVKPFAPEALVEVVRRALSPAA
ncbi:MAG: response regulator [Myxococcales bacterium]|nr:response regulator [Myxococcales bacterium]